jgi:hypothetical protein
VSQRTIGARSSAIREARHSAPGGPLADWPAANSSETCLYGGGSVRVDDAGQIQLMRYFWDAAVALNPSAESRSTKVVAPDLQPAAIGGLFRDAGLADVESRAIDVRTRFENFDDYWSPFLGGQGPAPGYAVSLSEVERADLGERIRRALPILDRWLDRPHCPRLGRPREQVGVVPVGDSARMRARIEELNAQAREKPLDQETPATVCACRRVYGRDPRGCLPA